ncbi:MAG: hypothetical protein HY397_00715 [Candidatus Doudnabacteria bacterium]|nr:hypothetical protein [Candidatus Doudnabacteria bacterium]
MNFKVLVGVGILAIVGLVLAGQVDERLLSQNSNDSDSISFQNEQTEPQSPFSPEPMSSTPSPAPSQCQVSLSKSYSDNKLGFTVKYPGSWFPSRQMYSNVFEIRNYGISKTPQPREKSGQVMIGPHEVRLDSKDALKRLDDIVSARQNPKDAVVKRFSIQGRPAVKISYKYPPAQTGFAQEPNQPPLPVIDKEIFQNYLAVADGVNIITVIGVAWEDTDTQVLCEIDAIISSLSLLSMR